MILGNRGIGHLLLKDQLLRSTLALSHARSVLVTTGFPTHFNHEPPEETDGPPGAIALAAFLQALGKETAMVVDQRALNLHTKIVEGAVKQGEQGCGLKPSPQAGLHGRRLKETNVPTSKHIPSSRVYPRNRLFNLQAQNNVVISEKSFTL